jgi:hypothetical protein
MEVCFSIRPYEVEQLFDERDSNGARILVGGD